MSSNTERNTSLSCPASNSWWNSNLVGHEQINRFSTCYQANCRFNADANTGHAFGIFMASAGALRLRLRRRLTSALGVQSRVIISHVEAGHCSEPGM